MTSTSFTLPLALMEALRAKAKAEMTNTSDIVRRALMNYLPEATRAEVMAKIQQLSQQARTQYPDHLVQNMALNEVNSDEHVADAVASIAAAEEAARPFPKSRPKSAAPSPNARKRGPSAASLPPTTGRLASPKPAPTKSDDA